MGFMSALTRIANGLRANDGTGDDLRSGASLIGANFDAVKDAVNAIASSQNSGLIAYKTKADMDADLSKPDGALAQVTNDPMTANNQSYRYDAATTTWVASVDRLANALGNGVGFQQAGAGSVTRDFQDKAREVVTFEDKGAVGDGITDDLAAIQAAIADAAARGVAVKVSGKTFCYSAPLTLNGVTIFGDGESSVLKAINPNSRVIYLSGSGSHLRNIKIKSTTTGLATNVNSQGIRVDGDRCSVKGVHIDGSNYMGIILVGATRAIVQGCRVENTAKDGIHQTGASSGNQILGNQCYNTGDDGIAVVGYQVDGDQCSNILIADNTVANGGARGITVVGARNVLVKDNIITSGTSSTSYALNIGYDPTFNTYACNNVIATGNILEAKTVTGGNGVVQISCGTAYVSQNITIQNNSIVGPGGTNARGLNMSGSGAPGLKNLRFKDNNVYGVGLGANIDFSDNIETSGNLFDTIGYNAVSIGVNCSGSVRARDNVLKNINTSGISTTNAFTIASAAGVTLVAFSDNYYAGENPIQRALQCNAPNATVARRGNHILGTTVTVRSQFPRSMSTALPSETAANIASAAATVNTSDKEPGTPIWDSTNHRVMVSSGWLPTDAWYSTDGATTVVPA